ncbi:2-succinylbenzoate--CoA ligase, chloroplastic/peroxisomal isoform X2 [Cinnamomum micranthum f. kanehirae]|uniref:2-succinylbenzoate--CoA ligase, chloroplastic/peroxisomal isoform X2 n=1 Tax=Cinnamomum micranthum f. kanehirae TaxID=337451 RepID=A0A3S3NHB9_9MAGN|nr:2-succinylbenzoate--CoA ligase, chloroplastic/peroxisomal isoform X2 [Cinnamomum micranthum f. kanehirae]
MDYTNEFITQEIFHRRDSLISWARGVVRKNSFVIVIKVSNAAQVGVKARVLLACERSGQYRHEQGQKQKRIKQIGLKKCGCPFALRGKKLESNDDWMLEVVCGMHNHSASEHLEGHSFAGRLSDEETFFHSMATSSV